MTQLTIGYLSTMYHTSHLLQATGEPEKRLRIKTMWRLFPTGPAMVEAFAAGELDLGYIGLPPAMIGISRGVPIICIAGGHVEGTVLIGPRTIAPVRTAKDIPTVLAQTAGKKIGTPAAGSIHDVILRWLVLHSSTAAVQVVNHQWADLLPEAIRDREIAAAAGTPQLAVLGRRFYDLAVIIPPQLLWPFNPSCGIVAHTRLRSQRRLLEDFLALHEQACEQLRACSEGTVRIVADAIRVVDEQFVREVFSLSPRYCASLPSEYIAATMAFVPVLRETGYLRRVLTRDDVFDTSCIEIVHPGHHHYTA